MRYYIYPPPGTLHAACAIPSPWTSSTSLQPLLLLIRESESVHLLFAFMKLNFPQIETERWIDRERESGIGCGDVPTEDDDDAAEEEMNGRVVVSVFIHRQSSWKESLSKSNQQQQQQRSICRWMVWCGIR